MFKNASPQTKSFVILAALAIVGTYVCLAIGGKIFSLSSKNQALPDQQIVTYVQDRGNSLISQAKATEPEIDTSQWKSYSDNKFGISFKYNPDWQIKSWVEKDGYNVLEIDPGKKFYNIKIYENSGSFYVMDGLPTVEAQIGGYKAYNVSNLLYGVVANDKYFTFDIGLSLSLEPQFQALVNSVKFE